MGNCLRQPRQLGNQLHKSMRSNLIPLIKLSVHDYSCCRDKVNRAAGQRTVVMVFASPPRQFYRDVINPAHLSGLSHLDNFIVTRKSCPLTGTVQKHMPTPTQTATPHTTRPLCLNSPTSSISLRYRNNLDNKISSTYFSATYIFHYDNSGLAFPHLHMVIHGFVFIKFTKQVHKHYIQISHLSSLTLFSFQNINVT